jgi:MFS family permease
VSLIFLSPLVGYIAAALVNNFLHVRFGQRGVAIAGPLCHVIAYMSISLHPPYPVFVILFMIAGFANGIEDVAWNAYLGGMANSNEVLGFLHGFYGIGAVLGPLVATNLITKAGWPWYAFYYIMVCIPFSVVWITEVSDNHIARRRRHRTHHLSMGVLARLWTHLSRDKTPNSSRQTEPAPRVSQE